MAETIESPEFIAQHRADPSCFSRRSRLNFPRLVSLIAQGFIKGLQSELDDFFGRLADRATFVRTVSKSAFSQARKKLLPSAFSALNDLLLCHWDAQVQVPRWHGFRLLAADTTTLRLPNAPEIVAEYGTHGDRWGGAAPMAMAFGLFDVAAGIMRHATLLPAAIREREALVKALPHVDKNDLLILDRGFPAYWLFAWLLQKGRHFCMRADAFDFKPLAHFRFHSSEPEAIVHVDIPAPAAKKADQKGYPLVLRSFRLRLIRVMLPSGQTEILATSLLDTQAYPAQEFAALYHRRWRIEEAFKTLKCRLAVEHFSGELPVSLKQDFLAKIWLANLNASLAYLAHQSLPKDLQSSAIPNLTYAVAALRCVLPRLMTGLASLSATLRRLMKLLTQTLERLRPGRSFPRNRQVVKPTKHRAYKTIR